MGRPDKENKFQLESLEPRLLLSGDPLWGMAPLEQNSDPELFGENAALVPTLEVSITESFLEQDQETVDPVNHSSKSFQGMFGHLSVEAPLDEGADGIEHSGTRSDYDMPSDIDSGETHIAYAFSEEEAEELFKGLEQFFIFLNINGVMEEVSSLTGASEGISSGIQQIINDMGLRLKSALYEYFTDGLDPPADYSSADYITQALGAGILIDGLDYSFVVSGGFLSSVNRVQFDLTLNATSAPAVRANPFFVNNTQNTEGSGTVTETVKLALSFGLDLNQSGKFFISVRQFTAGIGDGDDAIRIALDTSALPKYPASDNLDLNTLFQTDIKNYIRITLPSFSGDIHLSGYTLLYMGESVILESGQTLSGNGTISGDVFNRGIVSPGNSPGIDVIAGDYTQAGGELVIEIGGLTPGPGDPVVDDGYDQLQVGGLATLDDVLTISLINGFTPEVGQVFEFMTFGSVNGDFSVFSGLWLGDGLYF
ncbi:MAG: LEPR-XLL domain-containing protein, partial [Desulfobacterales bacterium]|nr:LEPR-XLL domain-containing protein [Desulfobacterales bacterium]